MNFDLLFLFYFWYESLDKSPTANLLKLHGKRYDLNVPNSFSFMVMNKFCWPGGEGGGSKAKMEQSLEAVACKAKIAQRQRRLGEKDEQRKKQEKMAIYALPNLKYPL